MDATGKTGSLYIVESPQDDQIYYVEDFRDKPDEEIKCHEVKSEPDIIIWKNMNTSLVQSVQRRLFSALALGAIFGLTILALDLFTNVYLKNNYPSNKVDLSESYACT